MTRKHFVKVAEMIKLHVAPITARYDESPMMAAQQNTAASIARDMANMFAGENGNFDRGRFFYACGLDANGRIAS